VANKSVEEIFSEMQKSVNGVIRDYGYTEALGLVEMLRSVTHCNFEFDFIRQRSKQLAERAVKETKESEGA